MRSTGSLLGPLHSPLQAEVLRVELRLAWWKTEACVVIAAVSFAAAFVVEPALNRAVGMLGITLALLSAFVAGLLRGGLVPGRPVQAANAIFEVSVPALLIVLEHQVSPRTTFLLNAGAPLAYGFVFLLAVLRMRRWLPAVMGLIGAVEYVVVVVVVVAPGAEPLPELGLGVVCVRAAFVLLLGVAAAAVVAVLRRAVGTAYRDVRAQELFGKYRLEEPIASGGMGEVLRARYCPEGGFERVVAVKRMHRWLAAEPERISAFRQEAEIGARLTHKNIVQVFDFGVVDGVPFLAMEYVDGPTLAVVIASCLKQGVRMPPRLVAFIGRELCLALSFAHDDARDPAGGRLGIVHRDVSPSNIMISHSGEVKITDFGIAKLLRDRPHTQTAVVMGKVGYMAPEQALAAPLDRRCDVFALSIVLWELLAGRHLFHQGSDAATIVAILQMEIPRISGIHTDIDPAWDSLFKSALERDVDRRLPSTARLCEALDDLLVRAEPRPLSLSDGDALASFVAGLKSERQ